MVYAYLAITSLILLAFAASTVASGLCKDDPTWFKDSKEFKTCNWIGRYPSRQANLCKYDNIKIKCPQSCRLCCEDDLTFTVTTLSTKERSCTWIGRKLERQSKYCGMVDKGALVEIKCPVACGLCTAAPTKSPSPSQLPSKVASQVPSQSQFPTSSLRPTVKECADKPDFKKSDDPTKTCDWIGRKDSRRARLCEYDYVRNNCPQTCLACCEDDPYFKIKLNRKDENDEHLTRGCTWIGRNVDRQARYCETITNTTRIEDGIEVQVLGALVKSKCPLSCGVCTPRTRAPIITPSEIPSSMPSPNLSATPSAPPSSNPTVSFYPTPQPTVCKEDPNAEFFWGLNNQKLPVSQTCWWLSQRKDDFLRLNCAKKTPYIDPNTGDVLLPPRDVCKVTCDTCYTEKPSLSPSASPSVQPSSKPFASPSSSPTRSHSPTELASMNPSSYPSQVPTPILSDNPSKVPSFGPSLSPSVRPSPKPSSKPSEGPTESLSELPSISPTLAPTPIFSENPSSYPSEFPTEALSEMPSISPSDIPSASPSATPTAKPSVSPTLRPTILSENPSSYPSEFPTEKLSEQPSISPSDIPSTSLEPTPALSSEPSGSPSPTVLPTLAPTSCAEDDTAEFFLRMNKSGNNEPIIHTCRWLQTRDYETICVQRTAGYQDPDTKRKYQPAKDVCRNTCDTCL